VNKKKVSCSTLARANDEAYSKSGTGLSPSWLPWNIKKGSLHESVQESMCGQFPHTLIFETNLKKTVHQFLLRKHYLDILAIRI
jgi:hypothetical protein